MEEIWKNIDQYRKYEVSSHGRVRNRFNHVLIPFKNNCGYNLVSLYKTSHKKNFLIHRLVALHFLENVNNKATVDHIDNDKQNNHRDNLRFATSSEQCYNKKKRSNTSSIYKGVSFYRKMNKWRTQVNLFQRKKHVGYYSTEIEAALAYNNFIRSHGLEEFTILNDIRQT